MESVLNLEWLAVAVAMCWLWMRHARREGPERSTQLVSLALVLITMFTVIAMYDDMAMAQYPAEARCFQREDDFGAHSHTQFHPVMVWTPTLVAELPFNGLGFAVPGSPDAPVVKVPVFSSLQNRPPPAV